MIVVTCSLWLYNEVDGSVQEMSSRLFGTTVSNIRCLYDENGKYGMFAVFPSLCIHEPGRYQLRFVASDLQDFFFAQGVESVNCSPAIFSEPFTIDPSRKFKGHGRQTELCRIFVEQGVEMPIRRFRASK
jgi:hypothetical protein